MGSTENKNSQVERFREKARELECDDSAEHFDATLKAVAEHAPAKAKRPSEKKDSRISNRVDA
jgi:hypothetical protein